MLAAASPSFGGQERRKILIRNLSNLHAYNLSGSQESRKRINSFKSFPGLVVSR